MLAYLDSVVIIYHVEQNPQHGPAADAWLAAHPAARLVSSELARMECLVIPVRTANAGLVVDFNLFFGSRVSHMIPLDRAVFERAADIRAFYPSIRTPDAIHLAAAVRLGCDVFVTNDPQLSQYRGVNVVLI